MSEDKKAKLRKLYRLEWLTNKSSLTKEEEKEVKSIRRELGLQNDVYKPEKTFVLSEYLHLVKTMPDASDLQRAKVMGISKNQLFRGKKRHNLINRGA